MSNPIGPQPGGHPPGPGSHYGRVPPRKGAGLGCLGLFLLAAVGAVMLGLTARNQYRHPSKNAPLGFTILLSKVAADGASLRLAIVAYHKDKGQYPQTLEQLASEDRIDGKMLHNDLDDHESPFHPSWRYTRPAEGAPGDTPILEEPYQNTLGGKSQPSRIVITLDGQSREGGPEAAP